MRQDLARWIPEPGQPITVGWWRGLMEVLERLAPEPEKGAPATPQDDHPFRVEVAHWEGVLAKPKDRAWRVDVSPGWCNDLPAAIPYRRENDYRGWSAPSKDWLPPGLPEMPSRTPDVVDRTLLEDDPPFLTAIPPPVGAKKEGLDDDFRLWTSSRPTYFQQEAYKEKELWFASVIVTASPVNGLPPAIGGAAGNEISAKLPERFRLRAGRAPITAGSSAGAGSIEIARLWLVRDPKAKDVLAADVVEVQQKVYTSLQALIVTPGLMVSDGSPLGDLAEELLNAALAASAGQEFWTG